MSSSDQLSFESVKARLAEIADAVDDEALSLDDALDLYEEAVSLGLQASDLLETGIALPDEPAAPDAAPAATGAPDAAPTPDAPASTGDPGTAPTDAPASTDAAPTPDAPASTDAPVGASFRSPGSPQANEGIATAKADQQPEPAAD